MHSLSSISSRPPAHRLASRWHLRLPCSGLLAFVLLAAAIVANAAESFRVATFNTENYLDAPAGTRPVKSAESRAKVRESIHALKADVLALQEMGTTNALLELRATLKTEGLDYPHWEHVMGSDTNINVAILSRFPIVARRPHTNEGFLLRGRRFRTSRGIAEVDIQVTPGYRFTLFAAHLKSRRPVSYADQADLREQEALILREKIDARFSANPRANILVAGDLNDVQDSRSTRTVVGRGRRNALIDLRPAERNGDPPSPENSRAITWTHFYAREDGYSRIDYLLISPGMAREWVREQTYVLALAGWGTASDHRPLVATFYAADQ